MKQLLKDSWIGEKTKASKVIQKTFCWRNLQKNEIFDTVVTISNDKISTEHQAWSEYQLIHATMNSYEKARAYMKKQ